MVANATPRRPIRRFVPVTVNGVSVPGADIVRETQHHPAADPDDAWGLAARALAIRELLNQEAERLQIEAEPIEDDEGRRETPHEARLRALVDREVAIPSADAASCRRYYDANLRRFRSPDLYEAAHILLPHGPQARALAERLVADLQQHPERFAEAASLHSACPSGKQGGNLGQLSPGQTVAEFEAALATLAVGELRIVESRYGLHIMRLDRRIEGRTLPFETVHERIAQYLEEAVRRRALKQYVSILASRAKVTGVDLAAASGPLVQ
jgi:peptidyl-prolyl cis-trans isomerase C